MNKIIAAARAASGGMVTKVGLPSESPIAMPPNAPSPSMADLVIVASVHEFGAPNKNIPERSFIRATFDENRQKIIQLQEIEAQRVVDGTSTPRESLSRIGEWLVAKTRKRIEERISPPLSPVTIAAKGSDVPLYDTGQLIQSLTHVEGQS